jgi:hypothetical protein
MVGTSSPADPPGADRGQRRQGLAEQRGQRHLQRDVAQQRTANLAAARAQDQVQRLAGERHDRQRHQHGDHRAAGVARPRVGQEARKPDRRAQPQLGKIAGQEGRGHPQRHQRQIVVPGQGRRGGKGRRHQLDMAGKAEMAEEERGQRRDQGEDQLVHHRPPAIHDLGGEERAGQRRAHQRRHRRRHPAQLDRLQFVLVHDAPAPPEAIEEQRPRAAAAAA